MPEISRLTGSSDWIGLGVVERERTPEPAMKLGIQSHVMGLSLSNTVELLDSLGVQRSKKAIHDWVQKADLQPESGRAPNQIALDETVIRIIDQQFWLYATATPQTNQLLHIRLFSTTTTALTEMFLRELRQKHDVEPSFSLMALNISKQHFTGPRFDFRYVAMEIGTLSNAFFESESGESPLFSNCFSHVEPGTPKWLQSFARWHNAPN